MLVTMGESPHIRYYSHLGEDGGPCAKLAFYVQQELDNLSKLDPSFPPESEYKRAILIIVDRSLDLMAPLLHEFTYQAMMADLLIADGKG